MQGSVGVHTRNWEHERQNDEIVKCIMVLCMLVGQVCVFVQSLTLPPSSFPIVSIFSTTFPSLTFTYI